MDVQVYQRFFRGKSLLIYGLIGVIGIGVLLNGISPYVFGKIVDAITALSSDEFKELLLLYLVIFLATQALNVIETLLGTYVVNKVQNEMQQGLMDRILALKCCESDKVPEGELFNRLEFDADTIVSYYIDLISSILMIAINLVISFYFIFHISAGLSGMVVAAIPVLYLVNFVCRKQIQKFQKDYKVFLDGYYETVNWMLNHLQFIKVFRLEQGIKNTYWNTLGKKLKLEIKGSWLSNKVGSLRGLLIVALNITILFCAGTAIISGQMSIGNMVAFNSYLSTLLEACNKVLELNLDKQKVNVCYERMLELEDWKKEEINPEDQSEFLKDRKIENIELKNVCFSYGSKQVLEGLNLCFNGSGLYTILGENGCGKTTILKLIERLYDSTGGEILINQRDITEYNLQDLRAGLAYMAKEPFFARDTVLNNLMTGTSGVTGDEAVEMCKRVGIHDDIMKLSDKYQTVVEPQGRNFSSGQKQKLGFARLLLQGASVFLLDEVTSDLDDISRERIWQIILELAEEHIVINVTHYGEYMESSKEVFMISEGKARRVN